MNKILLAFAVLLAGIALFFGGLFLGQADATEVQTGWMMRSGQQGTFFPGKDVEPLSCAYGGPGNMMGNYMTGPGFNGATCDGVVSGYGHGMMGNGFGRTGARAGMLNGSHGMMGRGAGMMGGLGYGGFDNVDPLSIEDAETAIVEYLTSLGNDSLAVGEIMIFDNHAYAQIVDTSSDIGAFEVLVDPVTRDVYAEPGPNMMWNTEYGHMSGLGGYGMMGGMMGSFTAGAEISVAGEEAIDIAQEYLDAYLPGATADETADPFPGYYTIHILQDGETTGMLSVNAYTGQVFFHHWHGELIDMAGDEHD